MKVLKEVVELLAPLSSDERGRVMRAAMGYFGETPAIVEEDIGNVAGAVEGLSPRARVWMKQNSVTSDQLQQVFHMSGDSIEVIAPQMPGKNKKEQTYNAYVISGIAQFLLNGNASFDDKAARGLCERSGCYDNANHSAHLRNRGNEFTGSKEKGWTLTAPGLKRGADLVKEMSGVGT